MRIARVPLCAASAAAAAAGNVFAASAAASDSTLSSSLGMPGHRRRHTVSRGTEQQREQLAVRYAPVVPHLEERNDISTLHLDIFILKNLTVTNLSTTCFTVLQLNLLEEALCTLSTCVQPAFFIPQ